jgi:hypothetical protein
MGHIDRIIGNAAKAVDKVIVVEIDWYGPEPGDYAGYVSVHRTEEGAQNAWRSRLASWAWTSNSSTRASTTAAQRTAKAI